MNATGIGWPVLTTGRGDGNRGGGTRQARAEMPESGAGIVDGHSALSLAAG